MSRGRRDRDPVFSVERGRRSGSRPAILRDFLRTMEAHMAAGRNVDDMVRRCRAWLPEIRSVCPTFGYASLTPEDVASLLAHAEAVHLPSLLEPGQPLWPYAPIPLPGNGVGYLLGGGLPPFARAYIELRHALLYWPRSPRGWHEPVDAEVLALFAIFNHELCDSADAGDRSADVRQQLESSNILARSFAWIGYNSALDVVDLLLVADEKDDR